MKFMVAVVFLISVSAYAQPMLIQRGTGGEFTSSPPNTGTGSSVDDRDELVICSRNSAPPPGCGMDINISPVSELTRIPGISSAMAARIQSGRPYYSVSEILDRNYVNHDEYDAIRNYLWVKRVSLNYSGRRELMSILNISRDNAEKIIARRPWSSVDDLMFYGIMSSSTLETMRKLITLR